MRTPLTFVAVALGAASLLGLGYALNDLANGITELPRHWWSMAPVLGLATALAIGASARSLTKR